MDSYEIVVGRRRGWVWIGKVTRFKINPTDIHCHWRIEDACHIRSWGTSEGLGELVNGPLLETVIDPVGVVECHELTVVCRYKVNEDAWRAVLLDKINSFNSKR